MGTLKPLPLHVFPSWEERQVGLSAVVKGSLPGGGALDGGEEGTGCTKGRGAPELYGRGDGGRRLEEGT